MAALFIGLWVAGGIPAGVLGEVVQAESARTRKAGRIAFAFLLWIDLLIAALVLAVGADAPTSPMSRSLWWFTIIAGGIPLALVSGLAVRRGYRGHLPALAAAVFTTAALYVVFPFAFFPYGQPLTGLGRWVHEHHLLGIAILFIPTLILLVNELLWNEEATPAPRAWSDPPLSYRRDPAALHRRHRGAPPVAHLAGRYQQLRHAGRARRRLRRHGAVPLVQGSRDPARRASGPGTA